MLAFSRICALVVGVLGPVAYTVRFIAAGIWPPLRVWPIAADAYHAGALLLYAAIVRRTSPTWLAAAWGVCFGGVYRSLFEQVADPTRVPDASLGLLIFKGVVLALSAAGALTALRAAPR
jgi:hypothetical protein